MFPLRTLVPFGNYSPHRIFCQHFGNGIPMDSDVHIPPSFGHLHHHFPLHLLPHRKSGFSEVTSNQDKFQIRLDCQHFSPDELTVKAVDKNVVVEAKHEEKEDEHGYITRSFTRRYPLPADINPDDFDDKVVCELSTDGVLMITIPRVKVVTGDANEKIIPITHTGKMANGADPL
ncbi:alpha-crystallin A chain [Folsomia candida]|uniref:alpha-crystallin A chain n=1 Tax=Folsomia candida TaxID=158441 RepID=UPI000B8EED2B|nr:alpha-crystallin A chain [Folsomia candida]